MNFSTLVGFLLSTAIFLAAVFTSSNNFLVFLDTHAILIVIGGTISASCVCFSISDLKVLFKVFAKRMIRKRNLDYGALLSEILELSDASRQGKYAFEAIIPKINDPFLKDAAEILFWKEADVKSAKLRYVLDLRIETHFERYMDQANMFKTMSKFPPAFGLMGTTLGMIALLQALGTSGAENSIGPAMSIALVATLYGIVIANFVFIPISENLTKATKEDLIARRMVVEGIMLIEDNMPTKFVGEAVKSLLLPSERKRIIDSAQQSN